MDTTATVEPARTVLDAGQEGRVVLSVRNDSEIVEDYSFQVVGDLADWSSVEPTHVSVYPGQGATAVLIFRPPRSSAVPAGEHSYGVYVRPAKHPEHATVPEGVVELLPFYDTVAELSPQSTRGRRGGRYRVAVDNRGNAPVAVALAGKSASDGMDLALGESKQTMDPGTTWSSEIRAEPVKRLWRGTPVAYPFTVMVRPEEGPEVALAGTQYQDPVLPAYTFKALLGALALGAAIFLGVWTVRAGDFPPWIEAGAEAEDDDGPGDADTGGGGVEGQGGQQGENTGGGGDTSGGDGETQGGQQGEDTGGSEDTGGGQGQGGQQGEDTGRSEDGTTPTGQMTDPPATSDPPVPVPSLPDTIPMWALPGTSRTIDWPWEPATGSFTVTSLLLDSTPGDVGTFSLVLIGPDGILDDQILLRDVGSGAPAQELVRQDGDSPPEPEGTPGTDPALDTAPVEPFQVDADQKLQLVLTCVTAGDPGYGACSQRLTVGGQLESSTGG